MRSKVSVGEYIAFLSVKYEVNPDSFFYALLSAWKSKESACGKLVIECRKKTRDAAVFLITSGPKVVAQFPISKNFLEQTNPVRVFANNYPLDKSLTKKAQRAKRLQIRDLKTGMRKINLKAEVLEIAKPTFVFTRFGNYASVANALISDKTGEVKLCLWNEQINSISEGDIIHVEDARVSTFRGERQLRVGKNGKLRVIENADFSSLEKIKAAQ